MPTNHLADQTSPYLLQHAHNPVDWYPWGTEAFEKARKENKLIFLSIGYSTCYWCHVMERESFENEDIAKLMNDNFVCIKVDREERPDVDDIYMAAVQILTGSGGWPMSMFLEPQSLKPFLGGTYFPPDDAHGRPGFPAVLRQMADYWKNKRDAVIKQAESIAEKSKEHLAIAAQPVPVGANHVERAVAQLMAGYDNKDGGFISGAQRAPKFPTPVNLDLLMSAAWEVKPAREAVLFTLDRMATGGMYDQIGGGFHRYSTDERWLVPHFEKMLYDNGQLASTYARAYERTKDPFYAQVLRETLDYVLREMTDSGNGGFYSAQDAEVNAQEGGNYLWLPDEIQKSLAAAGMQEDVDFALKVYGLDRGTNFQDPHHSELPPRNVIFLMDRPDHLAQQFKLTFAEFNKRVDRINAQLLKTRDGRPQPFRDDKIIAGWNGLMIAGMADGGRVLNDKRYTDAAMRAAMDVLKNMRAKDGSLLRTSRGGTARIDAFLEDYALMIHGLIALHRATGNFPVLEDAKSLAKIAKAKFWDASTGSAGGYFDTADGQSDLFVRVKSAYDGAIPSGNAVMLNNLIDLAELTRDPSYLDDASATLRSLSSVISQRPTSCMLAVQGLQRMVTSHPEKLEGGAGSAAAKPAFGFEQRPPVAISANPVEISIKPGSPATFNVVLRIDPAYHISSHEPGDEDLVPLKISLSGCDGLKLSVQYPKGEPYRSAAAASAFVHKGQLSIPVTIEQTGTLSGRPQLTLTYQACTDKECQEPKSEIVGIRIIAQK